jgi:hypothetical protein
MITPDHGVIDSEPSVEWIDSSGLKWTPDLGQFLKM